MYIYYTSTYHTNTYIYLPYKYLHLPTMEAIDDANGRMNATLFMNEIDLRHYCIPSGDVTGYVKAFTT